MARTPLLSWHEFFMHVAQIACHRSKDPVTQVGCAIVNKDNHIVGIGYNGLPRGCCDHDFPWGVKKARYAHNTKYPYVIHAEMNALINAGQVSRCDGGTLYTTLFPCADCAKHIAQYNIRRVIYLAHKPGPCVNAAACRIFRAVGIETIAFASLAKASPLNAKELFRLAMS